MICFLTRVFIVLLLFSTNGFAIDSQEIHYNVNDQKHIGFYAAPENIAPNTPGVIVVHEWWGHNEYVRERAKQLAQLGYAAFALDMYGDGKNTDHPKEAGAFSKKAKEDMALYEQRLKTAIDVLKNQKNVSSTRIAAIGYCFGGAAVLHMARIGFPLKAVASFHGSLASTVKAKKGGVLAKVLVLHGENDNFIKNEDITALKDEMKEAGADFKFIAYPGAVHGFSNPGATEKGKKYGINLAYNKEADQKSWNEMKAFFKKNL